MPGDSRKKKGGWRKDKKNERMRAAVQERIDMQGPARPSTDQPDIQEYKPGQAGDTTVHPKGGRPRNPIR